MWLAQRFFGGSPGPEKDCGWYCEFAPGLGDLGFWVYVSAIIAVALLASVQAMKQRKFFARLGGAVEVILRENMKPQLGNMALPRKADRISQAEECYQSIGLQQSPAMGAILV